MATESGAAPGPTDLFTQRFPRAGLREQVTADGLTTLWLQGAALPEVLRGLKADGYAMLYDLTVIDERERVHRPDAAGDFTVVYHLTSFSHNRDLRLKVALPEDNPVLPSITPIWPAADWYEREAWDMFGIRFDGHPGLRRILMPPTWVGHPLRKDHYARATEVEPYRLPEEKEEAEQAALRFDPAAWGLTRHHDDTDFVFLNLGPNHPSTHGVFRIILQLDGEEIIDAVPDIGYHHRGAEKMGERQTWHTYIPYTDRIDYLGGVMNNLPYVLAVEKLAGIEVPQRVEVIRIMLCELFRIASHLVFYGTFAQDLGAMSPVFFMFTDRERVFDIVEAICGGRMHPAWFRIGGVAQDLPEGWDRLVRDFVDYLPKRLDEYQRLVLDNPLVQERCRDIGAYTPEEAIEWGVTGPNLRACGVDWDFRKRRPYGGYQNFDFEVPLGTRGDSYDRCVVRAEELRQSLSIVRQCLDNMPEGSYKSDHPLTTPPRKEKTLEDIETLITHFLGVSWGPVIPAGEAFVGIEATKGNNGYYLVSDGSNQPYRVRIRTPSFPHLQTIPQLCQGRYIADLIAILGSLDFVMADVDR